MSAVDERIVRMVFDNREFIAKTAQTISSLTQLNKATDQVANNSGSGISAMSKAFSQAEITATQAGFHIRDVWLKVASIFEYQIAGKIVNVSKQIANAMTFEGINDGFREYELKMGSVQTIMAGTGASLQEVNGYLEDLNKYSDKTIYSFADMTNNIGKFTNAGVKLEDAVLAIKGIANEAARSGANANEASRAMYNFSQALSAGYVKLIDWKSIENANMATKEFKDMLLETAAAVGTVEKGADGMYKVLSSNAQGGTMDETISATKNFNDSLSYQWMTTEVLTTALKGYATDIRDMTEAEKAAYESELRSIGLTDEQIKRFEEIGSAATDAASEVKTFTMLIDTLKEAIGSGWAQTWEIIIGDFEEAKALWTEVSKVLGGLIDKSSEARNELLKGWLDEKSLNGRKDLIDAISNAFRFLVNVIRPVGQALKDIFPAPTAQQLKNISTAILEFSKRLQFSSEVAGKIRNAARGFFAIFDIGLKLIKAMVNAILPMGKGIKSIGSALLDAASTVGNFVYELDKAITESEIFEKVFQGIATVIKTVFGFIFSVVSGSTGEIKSFGDLLSRVFSSIAKSSDELISKLGVLKPLVEGIKNVLTGIANFAGTVLKQIGDSLSGFSFGDNAIGIANVLNTILGGGLLLKAMEGKNGFLSLGNSLNRFIDAMSGMTNTFSKTMNSISETMDAFQKKIETENLINIAKAIGILAASLFLIAMIDSDKLENATYAITGLMFGLAGAMAVLMKAVNSFSTTDVTKTFKLFGTDTTKIIEMAVTLGAVSNAILKMGAAVLMMAVGLRIVASAAAGGHLWDSFAVVSLMLAELTAVALVLSKWGGEAQVGVKGLLTMATAIVIMAAALNLVSKAVSNGNAWDSLGIITAMLAELTGIVIIIDQFTTFNMGGLFGLISMAVSLNLVVLALRQVSDALGQDGQQIWQALGIISILLVELTAVTILMSSFGSMAALGGVGAILAAGALLIMVQALKQISDALGESDQHVWQALGVIGASLVILAAGLAAMSGSIPGAAGLLVASAALVVLGAALKIIGSMSLAEIGKGLLAMAGSLLILAVGLTAMIAALPGAAALIVASAGLMILGTALKVFASISVGDIVKSLVALVAALVVIAVTTTALSGLAPFIITFSVALIAFGVAAITVSSGLLMFASALQSLIAVLPLGALAINTLGKAIIELIPVLANALMEALVIVTQKINEYGPEIAEGIKGLITIILDVIIDAAPKIGEAVLVLLTSIWQTLANNVPMIAQAGANVIIALINGLATQIPRMVDAAFKAAISLIHGLATAIEQNNEELISAVDHLMTAVLHAIMRWIFEFSPLGRLMPEELKKGILDVKDRAAKGFDEVIKTAIDAIKGKIDDFIQAGKDLVGGFIQGIGSGKSDASNAGAGLGSASVSGLRGKGGIDSHSPSIKGKEAGEDYVDGYDLGIFNGYDDAYSAGAGLGENSVDGLTDALSNADIESPGQDIIDTLTEMTQSTTGATEANEGYSSSLNNVSGDLDRYEDAIDHNISKTKELEGANLRAEQSYIRMSRAAHTNADSTLDNVKAYKSAHDQAATLHERNDQMARGEYELSKATVKNTEVTKANTEAKAANASASGGAGSAAKSTADVMEYASGVVQAFNEKYGELYSQLGDDASMKVAQFAVRNLAEETYKASLQTEAATEKTKENKASLEEMIKTFEDMKKKLYDSIQSYFEGDKFFQHFEMKTEMSMNALLDNMRSNIEGVTNWSTKLAELGEKGVSQGLLKYLGELGPQGFEYVNAFSTATAEQIQQANAMFAQSAVLPDQLSNNVLASYAKAGLNVVQGFANGIDENTALAVTAMKDANISTYSAFTDFWRIASPSKKMYADGVYMVMGLSDGIVRNVAIPVNAIEFMCLLVFNKVTTELDPSRFYEHGRNIGIGLAQGMESTIDMVAAAATKLSAIASAATVAYNLISSPSRRYMKYGSYIAEGLANGITGGSSYVERSAQMLSEAIYNTLSVVQEIAEDDIGIHPVITPTLDLSELKNKANTIGTLFPGQSLAMASSIGIGRVQNGGSSDTVAADGSTQINFTQNNYSPKELSRYEIYRQTKNQLSMMKGVVKANA